MTDVVPVISDIRTKVELFRIEHDYLPGVQTNGAGKALGMTSDLIRGAEITGTNGIQYMTGTVRKSLGRTTPEHFFCGGVELDSSDARLGCHVWKQIDTGAADLTGKKLRPRDIQYLVIKSDGDAYYWVVACFGQGLGGLAAGCGYAVAEYSDPASSRKFVATFEKYKPDFNGQLSFFVEDSTEIDAGDFRKRGLIYLPSWTAMTNDYDKAVEAMKSAGWRVD